MGVLKWTPQHFKLDTLGLATSTYASLEGALKEIKREQRMCESSAVLEVAQLFLGS